MNKLLLLFLAAVFFLGACGNNADSSSVDIEEGGHDDMNHSTSGDVPKGLMEAINPKFKVGTRALITADHMEGMNGATAIIVGAFETTVYTVSYTPTTGDSKVTNHKWVIHEEIKDFGAVPYTPGAEVLVQADHMKGMEGASAQIESAEQTTVYLVDFQRTTGGDLVRNHKWLTESELKLE